MAVKQSLLLARALDAADAAVALVREFHPISIPRGAQARGGSLAHRFFLGSM